MLNNLGKILNIKLCRFRRKNNNEDSIRYEGYVIECENNSVLIGVDDNPQCCETYGCLSNRNDLSYYIGSELLSVEEVLFNDCIYKIKNPERTDVMFVNVNTSLGTLQLALYNEHRDSCEHHVSIFCLTSA